MQYWTKDLALIEKKISKLWGLEFMGSEDPFTFPIPIGLRRRLQFLFPVFAPYDIVFRLSSITIILTLMI